jgi:hypothetical protein
MCGVADAFVCKSEQPTIAYAVAKQASALPPRCDCCVLVASVRASTASERVGRANEKIDAVTLLSTWIAGEDQSRLWMASDSRLSDGGAASSTKV